MEWATFGDGKNFTGTAICVARVMLDFYQSRSANESILLKTATAWRLLGHILTAISCYCERNARNISGDVETNLAWKYFNWHKWPTGSHTILQIPLRITKFDVRPTFLWFISILFTDTIECGRKSNSHKRTRSTVELCMWTEIRIWATCVCRFGLVGERRSCNVACAGNLFTRPSAATRWTKLQRCCFCTVWLVTNRFGRLGQNAAQRRLRG